MDSEETIIHSSNTSLPALTGNLWGPGAGQALKEKDSHPCIFTIGQLNVETQCSHRFCCFKVWVTHASCQYSGDSFDRMTSELQSHVFNATMTKDPHKAPACNASWCQIHPPLPQEPTYLYSNLPLIHMESSLSPVPSRTTCRLMSCKTPS